MENQILLLLLLLLMIKGSDRDPDRKRSNGVLLLWFPGQARRRRKWKQVITKIVKCHNNLCFEILNS